MFRATLNTSTFQNVTQIVRFQHPLLAWGGIKPGHAKLQCFGDSRDSENDSIFGARREIQRRRRHAPSCMGATESQRNAKNPWKTFGLPAKRTEIELMHVFPVFLKSSKGTNFPRLSP